MAQWGSTSVLVGGALLSIFLALVWTSSWLKGFRWFIATVLVLAASLISLEWDSRPSASHLEFWLTRFGLVYLFLGFFYVIGGRYLTQTKVMDTTFQSHDALVRFIDESGDSTIFANIMRKLGPALFVVLLIFGAVIICAKVTGALA